VNVSDIKTSVSKKLTYKTAIVDRVFLNEFVDSIKAPLELKYIRICGEISEVTGSDINDILDKFAKENIAIQSVSISASEPWDSEEYQRRVLKEIRLYSFDFQMTIEISGDDIDWVNGKEKSIDAIVNRGTRKHRWMKSQILFFAVLPISTAVLGATLVLTRLKHPPSYIPYIVWPLFIVGLILFVFGWFLIVKGFNNRVIMVPGDYQGDQMEKRLSPRDRRLIIWTTFITFFVTIFGGLLVGLLIELIRNSGK
jgi:hypothetical protein